MRYALFAFAIAAAAAPAPSHARGAKGVTSAMPAICKVRVVPMYGVVATQVKTGTGVRQKDGGYALKGVVDKGSEGIKPFQCNFDSRGRFLNVMSLVDEGAL